MAVRRRAFLILIITTQIFIQSTIGIINIEDESPSKIGSNSNQQIFSEGASESNILNAVGFDTNISISNQKLTRNIFEQFPGELCNRECRAGDRRVCYFKFLLEHYQAMGPACGNCARGVEADCNNLQCIIGDGFEKGVMSINRQIPGPAIQVCRGDLVVVDVVNLSGGTAAALHWHGLHMRATPWMDGVPFVTQCPISFSNTFRYQYWATEAGTQFYHSHAGHHKINGQYGALIIREPRSADKHAENYDEDLPEHYILISDWMHDYGENLFPGVPSLGGIFPDSVLINGRGTYINRTNGERKYVPPTRYNVQPGRRYRFRFINSISHACPFQIQIEDHNLTVIASDSYNVQPRLVDTLITNSGERYDFVVETNQPPKDYWIRVRGLGVCTPTDAVALLHYVNVNSANDEDDTQKPSRDMPEYNEKYPEGNCLNHPNATCFAGQGDYCITELQALEEDIPLRFGIPDYKFYLSFNNYVVPNKDIFRPGGYNHFLNLVDNLTVVGAINQLSLVFPPSPPLTQPDDIDRSMFCDQHNRPSNCVPGTICPCIHRLAVRTGSIVELIVIDESRVPGRLHHPFHLHGYPFLVTKIEQPREGYHYTAEIVRKMDMRNILPRDGFNIRPPWKDTVSIPSYGYAILRFRADNPGYWLMHCHYEWHLAVGMGLIVQVGDDSEMVPPPEGFPKCGNFLPGMLNIA